VHDMVLAPERLAEAIERRTVRLNRMNVVVPEGSAEPAEHVTYVFAQMGGPNPRSSAFAFVRFPRASLLASGLTLDEAARALA